MAWNHVLLAVAVVLISVVEMACGRSPQAPPAESSGLETDLRDAAQQVLSAFKVKDGQQLAQLVHPEKGVRFTPYTYVDLAQDRVFTRSEIADFWKDQTSYFWGVVDGTDDERIDLTPGQYVGRYVLDRDFAPPALLGADADRTIGANVTNAAEAYPEGHQVAFSWEPPPGKGDPGYDTSILRFVFEPEDGGWYLVAVIHNEWTP